MQHKDNEKIVKAVDEVVKILANHLSSKKMRYEVIECILWRRDDGKTASPYSVTPWQTADEEARWSSSIVGWTVRNPYTGEIGVGRKPWTTREEAEKWASTHTPSRVCIGD